ncbi:hypothetical protein NDU88_001880 [Pleurodeles waltl]|uniref:Uncharacterized protein n=1 Tax=Pleurodeles waltl TaxID=8319 RepID=A0AAV7RB61_PLEWA|nr:hypothetical protein NDU88_001880 [Pleurodeles waltl]
MKQPRPNKSWCHGPESRGHPGKSGGEAGGDWPQEQRVKPESATGRDAGRPSARRELGPGIGKKQRGAAAGAPTGRHPEGEQVKRGIY